MEQLQIQQESERIKNHNKQLFQNITSHQESKVMGSTTSDYEASRQSEAPQQDDVELADIHGLY